MNMPIANAVARLNAQSALKADPPGRSLQESEIALLRAKLDAVLAENDALLRTNRETRTEMGGEITRLQAELAAAGTRCEDAERRCAEMQGRISGMGAAPKPAVPDNSKYESLVAEYTDLRVMHGSCAARENGLQQVIAELRRANETLTAQVQAALTEEEEPKVTEDEDGGCEIDVMRGGDNLIRSLKVRYTK